MLSSVCSRLCLRCLGHTWGKLARWSRIIMNSTNLNFRLTMSQAQGHNDQTNAAHAFLKRGRERQKNQYQSDTLRET